MRRFALAMAGLMVFAAGCAHHEILTCGDTVTLTLRAPQAGTVEFAASLDGFQTHPARCIDGKSWEVTMPAGSSFSYFYLVDGEVYVPDCTLCEPDGFGSKNCIYVPGM